MRVLHVISLHTPSGDFGGPVRVAANLARGLVALGDEVVIAGGCRGFGEVPVDLNGVECSLFPVASVSQSLGFSGLVSPAFYSWLWSHVSDFDVVHVHLAREPQTMAAAEIALARGVPVVLQTHGMVDASDRILATWVDFRVRSYLRRASRLLWLTPQEESDLRSVARGPSLRLAHLPNGVPRVGGLPPWDARAHIAFLGRLAPRKRPVLLVEAVAQLHRAGHAVPPVRIAGPDEGELEHVLSAIDDLPSELDVKYVGALDHGEGLDLLKGARALVLPSVNEPYPMSVLEALSCGTPVVITTSCGLAPHVRELGCGVVVEEEPTALAPGIAAVLKSGGPMGEAGVAAVAGVLGIDSVTEGLREIYREVLTSSTR